MGCLTAERRAVLTARKAKVDAAIDVMWDGLTNFDSVQGYTFDSGEGKQSTTYRTTDDLLKSIRRLEATSDFLYRQLSGTGNPALNLRRRKRRYYGNC